MVATLFPPTVQKPQIEAHLTTNAARRPFQSVEHAQPVEIVSETYLYWHKIH
jgi:hypothetical protein